MHDFEFSWVVDGFDMSDDASLDRLYEAFSDVAAGSSAGRTTVEFVVEAASQSEALFSTLRKFESVFPQVRVLRIDRDLVSIPDVASRTSRTPESVRLLVNGQRGPGTFPSHVGILGGGTRVWEWAPVAGWFALTFDPVEKNELIDHRAACEFDAHLRSSQRRSGDGPIEMPLPPRASTSAA